MIARTVILPETLEGYTVRYGMPSYESEAEVALRAAGSPSSSTCGPVPDQYRDGFPTSGIGTGGVLLSSAKQIGLSLIERMARDSVESAAPIR